MKECKQDYYSRIINENKKNPNALWKTLNEITSRKQQCPITSIESNGIVYSDQQSIANILNKHFSTVAIKLADKFKDSPKVFSPAPKKVTDATFTFQPVTEQFVLHQLLHLKTNKAIGLDRISARLLKDSATVMSSTITSILNRSLESRTFPKIWKQGKVAALFKSGDRLDSNNYRPITVLSTISKILERAVHQQLYTYLQDHKILSTKQFGFRSKLSTTSALIHFTDNILLNLDEKRITGAAFIDLSKAFDTVDHNLLKCLS